MKHSHYIAALRRELHAARAAAELAHREARTDEMTGLGNRRRWREETERLQSGEEPFAVILFDLANLKAANERLGHVRADLILKDVASAVRSGGDLALRLGGDEFAVILPDVREVEEAERIRRRIERQVGMRSISSSAPLFLAGAVAHWRPGLALDDLLLEAELELERRKAARKVSLGAPTDRAGALAGA